MCVKLKAWLEHTRLVLDKLLGLAMAMNALKSPKNCAK
jgi:hypothetical protein